MFTHHNDQLEALAKTGSLLERFLFRYTLACTGYLFFSKPSAIFSARSGFRADIRRLFAQLLGFVDYDFHAAVFGTAFGIVAAVFVGVWRNRIGRAFAVGLVIIMQAVFFKPLLHSICARQRELFIIGVAALAIGVAGDQNQPFALFAYHFGGLLQLGISLGFQIGLIEIKQHIGSQIDFDIEPCLLRTQVAAGCRQITALCRN